MKKVNSACAMLLAASCFVACDNDNNNALDANASGKVKMVLSLSMGANETSVGYIVPVSESSLMGGGTLSLAHAHEVNESPYVETYKDWAFYVANLSFPPVIRRYARQDDGSLLPSGELALSQNNQAGLANILFLSDTKAYASLTMENKIAIFNPTTMQITGGIDLAKPEYGVGSATPNPAGMLERDGKVFCRLLRSVVPADVQRRRLHGGY
jgi:hypothetical protein